MLTIDLKRDMIAQILFDKRDLANSAVLLRAIAEEQDRDAVEADHFEVWFALTHGRPVRTAYPGVLTSYVMGLYQEAWAAHVRDHRCRVTWSRRAKSLLIDHDYIYGEFQCDGGGGADHAAS